MQGDSGSKISAVTANGSAIERCLAKILTGLADRISAVKNDPAKARQLADDLRADNSAVWRELAYLAALDEPDADALVQAVMPRPKKDRKRPASTLTPVARRQINAAALDDEQDDPLYQHTVLCQTCLPYRNPGNDVRTWKRTNGRAGLQIEAGGAWHRGDFVELGLPFGPKPRLVLMHLNAEAVRTSSPIIEVEATLSAFIRRLKLDTGGRTIRPVKDQLARLSASSIRLGMVKDGREITVNTQVVTAFDLWFPKDERQRVLWPTSVQLSADYFQSLKRHAVPLEEHAIRALAHNAMGLDIYAWLTQRLHHVPVAKPQFVAWTQLRGQFGWNYDRLRDFRRVFLNTLRQVKTVYPAARIDEEISSTGQPKGLALYNSPTPVPKRAICV